MYRGTLNGTAGRVAKKTCPQCRRSLTLNSFDPNRARRDGRQSHCRKCRKEQRETGKNGNGRHLGNGNGHRAKNEEVEGESLPGYTPLWKQPKANRKQLLLQRDRYLSIINAASLALESIEARLGISGMPIGEEEDQTAAPEVVEAELSDEDIEEDLE